MSRPRAGHARTPCGASRSRRRRRTYRRLCRAHRRCSGPCSAWNVGPSDSRHGDETTSSALLLSIRASRPLSGCIHQGREMILPSRSAVAHLPEDAGEVRVRSARRGVEDSARRRVGRRQGQSPRLPSRGRTRPAGSRSYGRLPGVRVRGLALDRGADVLVLKVHRLLSTTFCGRNHSGCHASGSGASRTASPCRRADPPALPYGRVPGTSWTGRNWKYHWKTPTTIQLAPMSRALWIKASWPLSIASMSSTIASS
jgi:hypothetical protein